MARVVFILLLIFVAVFPLFQIEKQKEIKKVIKKKAYTVIINGKYSIFDKVKTKEGNFSKAIIYKNKYLAYNFTLKDLIKKNLIVSKKIIYKKPLLTGYNVNYITDEYNLSTNFANYNILSKLLTGKKFKLLSLNYRGYGDSFEVDKDKNIYATNIKYFLKVKE